MEAFKWNIEHKYWHLFEEHLGIHCYLLQVISPPIPGTKQGTLGMPFIYALVQALIDESGTWTLQANPFSNVYDALEHSETVLGYLPKFRDPQEQIYYADKEVPC